MGIQMKMDEIDGIILGIGQAIKKTRKEKKITAADLAATVGLGRMTINRIEAGDTGVSMANVLKVASALALDLDMRSMVKPEHMLMKLMQLQVGKPSEDPGSAPLNHCESSSGATVGTQARTRRDRCESSAGSVAEDQGMSL